MKRIAFVVALVATSVFPSASRAAGEIVTNPFGNLTAQILTQPSGTTAGTARLTIHTNAGAAFTPGHDTIYFGLRIMGSEDLEMTSFSTTGTGCIVSDFKGQNTTGWQGATAFGTGTPAGSLNSHMRMVGGFLKQSCGDLVINTTFRSRPFVAFYGAFFGYNAAPWHNNYGSPPWNTVPTGGNPSYQQWWNIWGTFDTLGYSNACVNVAGTDVSCG